MGLKSLHPQYLDTNRSDLFIKSNITFKANDEKIKDKRNFTEDLASIGIIAAPFITGLALATCVAKNDNPEQIFLSDGTYFMNTKEMSISSGKMNIDGDDGIIQIKGTGIDITPERFSGAHCFTDPQAGIFKNFNKGIDIDLANNKYIDPENGIFIDPSKQISAIEVDGELKNIVIPNFTSGYPTNPNTSGWGRVSADPQAEYEFQHSDITRAQFIAYYGSKPEDGLVEHDGLILLDDKRTITEKILDFFTGNGSHNKQHDVFGREIKTVQNVNAQPNHIVDNNEKLDLETLKTSYTYRPTMDDFLNKSSNEKNVLQESIDNVDDDNEDDNDFDIN